MHILPSLRLCAALAAATAACACAAAHAAPPATKMAPAKKTVMLYQAAKCHMYYTPAQAKMYHYACPDSHGKMSKVMVTPALAKAEMAKTSAALAPAKKAM